MDNACRPPKCAICGGTGPIVAEHRLRIEPRDWDPPWKPVCAACDAWINDIPVGLGLTWREIMIRRHSSERAASSSSSSSAEPMHDPDDTGTTWPRKTS